MTLSIEVLPAPFGPMMARISPLRISNETPLTAFTPPKASETPSTASRTSPAAISCPLGALMRRLRGSCRLLHRAGHRHGHRVADLDARGQHAFAAVLEGHLGRDGGFGRAVVERRDQRRVALADQAAAHLLRTSDLAVVGIELLVQDEKAPDLSAGHHLVLDQRAVHLGDMPGQ